MSEPRNVRLFVCGNADRGDDAAAIVAVTNLLPNLSPDLATLLDVRWCEQLEVEDLLDLPTTTACVIVDTVVGIPTGSIATVPLAGLVGSATLDEAAEFTGATPRSSHILPISQLLALADVLRDSPVEGMFVGLGGSSFGFERVLGSPVLQALPAFQAAIEDALTVAIAG
jgi:hydrogenase maturation protease